MAFTQYVYLPCLSQLQTKTLGSAVTQGSFPSHLHMYVCTSVCMPLSIRQSFHEVLTRKALLISFQEGICWDSADSALVADGW